MSIRNAVFGATGAVGKALASALARSNERFRVVGRSEQRLRRDFARYGSLVEFCEADLSDADAAARAAAGATTVFYLVGVPYTQFDQHPRLSRIALTAAADAGVRRFVHLGTVYPFGKPERDTVDESHPRNPHTFKGRMRKEQEDLVLAAHDRNGMQTTILRPPDFYGPGSELSYARAIFDAALKGGAANVIGPIETPHEFIFVPDVATALLALSESDEAYGQAWNIGGAGVITTQQFAEFVFAAAGRKPRLRAAGKTMLRLMGLFSPFMREVAEMHYLWTTPVILDDRRLRSLLPALPRTSYEDGIRETLRSMTGGA